MGFNGVGKTRFCQKVIQHLPAEHVTASSFIREAGQRASDEQKRVRQIAENQDVLVLALKQYQSQYAVLLLDEHFCLLNKDARIEEIPTATFVQLAPKAVILLDDEAEIILERLHQRDRVPYDLSLITELKLRERNHAQHICVTLQIPLYIHSPSRNFDQVLSFIVINVSALRGQK